MPGFIPLLQCPLENMGSHRPKRRGQTLPDTASQAQAAGALPLLRPGTNGFGSIERLPESQLVHNRNFLLLWLAQAISQTAQNAIWYGIVVLVEERSRSSTQLSLAVLTLIVPSVIFGVLAGVYVDRWDKRLVLIVSNVLRGGVALAYVAFGEPSPPTFALLFLVNFVFSTIGQFFAPAEAAMIPAIVPKPQLLQANSLFHLTFTASQLIGLVLMGPLLAKLVGVQGLFAGTAAAIVLCGALVWPLPSSRGKRIPHAPATEGEAVGGVIHDARTVWRYVVSDRVIALSMVQWTTGAILALVVATLVPGFSERVLRVRAEDVVFVMAPAGVGMVGGTALLNRWGRYFDKRFLAIAGLFTVSTSLTFLGLLAFAVGIVSGTNPPLIEMPVLGQVSVLAPVVMAVSLVAGLGFVSTMVPPQTFLQESAPVELRGRVFAVLLMLSNLVSIFPLIVLGGLADLIGVDLTFVLVGLIVGAVGVLSVRVAPGRAPWEAWEAT